MHASVLMISVVVLILPDYSYQACMGNWHEYKQGGTCFTDMTRTKTWHDARTGCQYYPGGDILQIWDKLKQNFLEKLYTSKYWIGVSDFDNDGVFEYLNGTKVLSPRPGLGTWQEGSLMPGNKKCVGVDFAKGGTWFNADCKQSLKYICEMYEREAVTSVDAKCTLTNCRCDKSDWLYYGTGKIYIRALKVLYDFEDSKTLCHNLGGHLLRVSDASKQFYVQGLKKLGNPKSMYYWIGLSTETGAAWKWDDGKALSGYHNWWLTTKPTGKSCVAVLWDYDGKWRHTSCKSLNYLICEANSPCPPLPSFTVNGKTIKNNGTVSVIEKEEVKMKCELVGSRKQGAQMTITCDWGNVTKKATTVVKINHLMHMKQCYCRATEKDGSQGDTSIYIFALYGPRLAVGQRNNRAIRIKEGGDIIINSILTSNPAPKICNVTKKGVLVDAFKVRVEGIGRRFTYSLSIGIHHFSHSQTGRYVLQLGNMYGDPLKFIFDMRDPRVENDPDGFFFKWLLLVLIAIVTTIIIAVGCMFIYKLNENSFGFYGRKHSVSTDFESTLEDEDYEATAHETVSCYDDYTSIASSKQHSESKSTAAGSHIGTEVGGSDEV